MANYYNVTAYKHTGFDYYNRPFSRDVLESEAFKGESFYSQVDGIAVNRQDMKSITYIDLQGSVKDLIGSQDNPPNATGSRPLDGPYYNWEEVDYIRLARTGYPGDVDFVDISSNMADPWNADTGGRKALRVAYYFVTGLEPLSRNVTRLHLQFDDWTSCGASDELEIETGYKVRGMITDAEDSSSYNIASESIGLLEPLITISGGDVAVGDSGEYNVLATSTWLPGYKDPKSIEAILATATNGQTLVFPEVLANTNPMQVVINNGLGDSKTTVIRAYGYFDYSNTKIMNAVSVLYSAGVLEMRDSVCMPKAYIELDLDGEGQVVTAKNKVMTKANPASRDIGAYPRKADYMFGSEILFSKTTGTMNIQKYSELTDRSIQVWATPVASGTPYARFKGIKQHAYGYDQAIQGSAWQKGSIVLQGASGATFNQLNAQFAQQSVSRSAQQLQIQNQLSDSLYKNSQMQLASDTAFAEANAVTNVVSNAMTGNIAGAVSGGLSAAQTGANAALEYDRMKANRTADLANRELASQAQRQAQAQLNVDTVQQSLQSPSVNFVPDLNGAILNDNGFYCYTVNTSAKDRERLKNYFLRYGYKGLYKPLTFAEINVKKRVNYIQTEGVCMKHKYYAYRDLIGINNLLNQGVWLWNEKPNQAAFADNADN